MNLTMIMRLSTAAHALFRTTLYHAPIDASYVVDIKFYCNRESHFKTVSQGCTVRLHEVQSTVAMTSSELSTFHCTLSACYTVA